MGLDFVLASDRFCVISGDIVKIQDTIIWKPATNLTHNFLRVIALVGHGLIARIVHQLAFGILSMLKVQDVSFRKLFK